MRELGVFMIVCAFGIVFFALGWWAAGTSAKSRSRKVPKAGVPFSSGRPRETIHNPRGKP